MHFWEVYDLDAVRVGIITPHVDNKESPILRACPPREETKADEEAKADERTVPHLVEEPARSACIPMSVVC